MAVYFFSSKKSGYVFIIVTFYFQGDTTSKDRPLIIIIIIITWGFAGFYFEILWEKKVLKRSLGKYYLLKLQKEFD